jgi:adenylate cyclase
MDVAGFTSISELLDPDTLVGMMAELFGECSKIIVQHKGNIDKYIGDCIMAFWGAPHECPHQETWAVTAAIKIQRFVRDFAKVLEEEGLPKISVRIGLNTGPVLVG